MITWHQIIWIVWTINALLVLIGTFYTIWRSRRSVKPSGASSRSLPPISILKPVKGADPGLYENLKSFVELDYPDYELLICTADPADPAVAIVRQLQTAYPLSPIKLVQSDPDFGFNPKVANLHPAWSLAAHDMVLISDSNVRADRDYLKQLVPLLSPDTGTVTASIRCFGGSGLGGRLEEGVWNSFYARWVNLAYAVGRPIVIGKSLLFRQSLVNRFGGFSSCIDCIGEDYKFDGELAKLGKRIDLMHRPMPQFVGKKSLSDYWSRNYRWHFLQKNYEPLMFMLTPLQYPAVLGALTGTWAGWVATMALWAAADAILLRALKSPSRSLHIWLLGQLISPLIWVQALCCNSVRWRGNRFNIKATKRPLPKAKPTTSHGYPTPMGETFNLRNS